MNDTADRMHALGVGAMTTPPRLPWHTMDALPEWGSFLFIYRAPTSWAPYVQQVDLHQKHGERLRRTRLRYAVAWCHAPALPDWLGTPSTAPTLAEQGQDAEAGA